MKQTLRWLPALAGAVIALLLVAILHSDGAETVGPVPFPDKTGVRLFLPAAPGAQIIRYERYEKDGHRAHSSITYYSGLTEEIDFRSDGSAESSTQYYPDPGDGTRPVRSRAKFDRTGAYFVEHQVYRQDGSLERSGQQLRDGRYEAKYFYADGATVSRVRYFSAQKKLIQEKRYDQDGSLIAAVTLTNSGDLAISLYGKDGALVASFEKGIVSGETGQLFSPDGKSRVALFNRTQWSTEEIYFDLEDHLTQRRVGYMGSEVVLVFLPPSEKPAYRQVWRKHPARADKPAESILSSVDEYNANGLYRTIAMVNDGSRPDTVTYYLKGGKVVKHLSADGVVTSVEKYEGSKMVSVTVPAKPEKEQIDSRHFADQPHPALPTYSDDGAPPMMYDYP